MPTRLEYRRRFANDLHALGPTVTGGVATGGDTHTPSTLIQATWPVLSLVEKEDRWEGAHLFRPNAVTATDYVRRIEGDESYVPSAGTFVTDGTYVHAPASGFSADVIYELHLHGFDPSAELDDLLGQALKEIMIPVQVPLIPQVRTGGTFIQNLTSGDGSSGVHTELAAILQDSWVLRLDLLPTGSYPVQTLSLMLVPSGGTTAFSFLGVGSAAVQYNDTAATIQSTLRTLPGLEEVTVSGDLGTGLTFNLIGAPLDVTSLITLADNTLTFAGGIPVGVLASTFTTVMGIARPISARLFQRGPDVMAEFDQRFVSGDRVYVTALVRAYDWCRASSLTAYGSQAGLSAEVHEAAPIVEWVSAQMQVQAWLRNPRLMQENLEKRRCLALGDAQALAAAYQDAYLKGITVSDLLTFDVKSDPFKRPLPALLSGAGGAS